jgi:two-component system chemotaxis response regulator CheY
MKDKKKILLVEDMDAVRDIVGAALVMKGYMIEKVENGKVALGRIKNNPEKYDLILSDYDMPEMNGIQLLTNVRSHPSTSSIPFIMLTSRQEPDKIKQAKALGLSAWIIKPYKIDTFIAQVEYAMKPKNVEVAD